MHLVRVAALLVVVAPGGCSCGEELNIVPGTLNGRVCDPESGIGLKGAGITLEGESTKRRETLTDAQGNYTLERVLPGPYTVTATLDDMTRVFDVRVETQRITLVDDEACRGLPPVAGGGVLQGQICNRHTGLLVGNAEVAVLLSDSELMLTTTDADGSFELTGVPPGDHVVRISGEGFQRSFEVTVREGQTTALDLAEGCEPVSATEGGILGSLCNPEAGGNLVGAAVTITRADGTGEDATDLTDTEGVFQVNGLPPGMYNVDVTHPDHGLALFGVEVFAGAYTTVLDVVNCDERPEFGRIEGQICHQDAGGRFEGAVELRDLGGIVVESTTSDDEGRFEFNGLSPGTYTVRAFTDGYERLYPGVVVVGFQTSLILEQDCPSPEDICQDFVSQPVEVADGRILFVVDRSGSMEQLLATDSISKWSATKAALESITTTLNDTVEFGIMLYPDASGNTIATGACNEDGDVELPIGPNNAANVEGRLDASVPLGGTPTAAALAAARAVLPAVVADGRPLAVLLATDGAPNCNSSLNGDSCVCTTDDFPCPAFNCLDDANAIAQVGAIRDLGVSLYVLGLPGTENFGFVLNNMATVGGTALPGTTKYYEANDQEALEGALEAITNRVLSCRVDTDADLAGTDSIAVTVDGQGVARDPARQNGWDLISSTTIELFGAACDLASASLDGVVVRACNER